MSHISRILGIVLALALGSARALACGGPCNSPELWNVLPLGETPVVVSNFGLLSPTAKGDWQLTCEETIGDVILSVRSNGSLLVASTETGLYLSTADTCGYRPGPQSPTSSWFFDFAIAADSNADAPHLLGLVSEAATSSIHLESTTGGNFEVLHSFGSSVAYRRLEAAPDFSTLVVAGYASQPRRWKLALSRDFGATWREFEPTADSSSPSIALLGFNPAKPDHIYFQVQGTLERPAELWVFDAQSDTSTRLWTAPPAEAISGFAISDGQVWLATRGATSGGLYRTDVATPGALTSLGDAPPLACLGFVGGTLFACSADYTAKSPFLLARVDPTTAEFTPSLTIRDLGELQACGAECQTTLGWLHTLYGSLGGVDTEAPGQDTGNAEPPRRESGGCRVNGTSSATPVWLALASFLLWRRRLVI
jgi:hypothetical protein